MNNQYRTKNIQWKNLKMRLQGIKILDFSNSFQITKVILVLGVYFFSSVNSSAQESVKIGSKLFTESVILGEITSQLFEAKGLDTDHFEQLGGTRILWNALQAGEIDIYPEYTGTIIQEILQGKSVANFDELRTELRELGVGITDPIGFNNTYALGMKNEKPTSLKINAISDLKDHEALKYGFSNEFLDREDGWKGLRIHYALNSTNVTGLDHDLAYRGLDAGNIDVIDLYSTDAEIDYYNLKVLEDDLNFFPEYEAIFLYRLELENSNAEAVDVLKSMAGLISEEQMIGMNAAVKLNGKSDGATASEFIQNNLSITTEIKAETMWSRLLKNTWGHLYLVGISLGLAIIVAIPLGVLAAKVKSIESSLIGFVGVLQTIPSLALLVFMIPLLGIGSVPAMAALFLYSLLPIVRNTHSGIKNISEPVMESAYALGLPNSVILKKIELPIALPTILAGIKTSAVINVGTATLGALIGAGGYGQPILTGIRLDSTALILEGAIPAAVLALLVQGFFDLIEKRFVNS
ncbi:MAG: glycine betaine ABC transporter substrate-binding protein [Balneola sp.]